MSQDKPILLMVTSQDWGGAQAYVFNLALELQARNLPVSICAGRTEIGKDNLNQKCKVKNISFIELKHMARDINPVNNCLALFELINLFRRLKPQAIQLNSSMMGAVGSLAGYLTKVPKIVYTAHGWVFNEQLPSWKKNLYIWIEKISAYWKHIIICLYEDDARLAERYKIRARQKTIIIPNGINVTAFESQLSNREEALKLLKKLISDEYPLRHPALDAGSRNSWTKRDDNRENDIIIGTVANAYPPKNLLWYLDTCQAVHEKNPDIKFVIVGDGPQMPELIKKHHDLKQGSYVYLAGRQDPKHFFKAFDIFVLPSSKEGMPITILEAMAAQLPIIATDVGACRIMLNPDTGLIVPPNDLDIMTQAILNLAKNKEQQKNLGEQAYQKVQLVFTWQKTADQTIKELSDS